MNDFNTDLQPYIEKHYRVLTDRANTAIAGLSMGGNHTLQIAFPHLDRFAYIGVYSSGSSAVSRLDRTGRSRRRASRRPGRASRRDAASGAPRPRRP